MDHDGMDHDEYPQVHDQYSNMLQLLMQHSTADLKDGTLEDSTKAWKINKVANMNGKHVEALPFFKTKLEMSTMAAIGGDTDKAEAMRESIKNDNLIAVRYVHSIKAFLAEGPAPLIDYIAASLPAFDLATADNRYALAIDTGIDVASLGTKEVAENRVTWLNIYLAPGTNTPSTIVSEYAASSLKEKTGIIATKITVIRGTQGKYANVQCEVPFDFNRDHMHKLKHLMMHDGKYARVVISRDWLIAMGLGACCFRPTERCECQASSTRRLSSSANKEHKKRKAEASMSDFRKYNRVD
jgi:hypothetical protein